MATSYLTPGVYVEEVPSANKPIEGVGTSIAAFVGLAPGGPVNRPTRISNWTQFSTIFGDAQNPENGPFMEGAYLAHAVYGFFQNGGGLCWIVRVGSADGGVRQAAAARRGRCERRGVPGDRAQGRRLGRQARPDPGSGRRGRGRPGHLQAHGHRGNRHGGVRRPQRQEGPRLHRHQGQRRARS